MTPHSVRVNLIPGETVDKQFVFTGEGHQSLVVGQHKCGDVIVIVKDAKETKTGNDATDTKVASVPLQLKRLSNARAAESNHSNDLFAQCPISLGEILLGGVLQFIHLDGEQWNVQVPPIEFTMLRLPLLRVRGAGMPLRHSAVEHKKQNSMCEKADAMTDAMGDLWIQLQPQFPSASELQTLTAATTLEQLSPNRLLPQHGKQFLVLTRMVVAEQVSDSLSVEINSCI